MALATSGLPLFSACTPSATLCHNWPKFTNSIFINDLLLDDFDGDSELEILALADNNNLRNVLPDDGSGANYKVVFLLDSRDIEGQAFPPTIEGVQSGHELWYAFAFPQGEAISHLQALDYDNDGVLDAVFRVGGILYYVDAAGTLLGVGYSDGYHPNEPPGVQVYLICKDTNGEWETIPLQMPDDEEKLP